MNSAPEKSPTALSVRRRLASLLVFNRHRRLRPSNLPQKPSQTAEMVAVIIFLLVLAAIVLLLHSSLLHRP
jgi:hypothetical protein